MPTTAGVGMTRAYSVVTVREGRIVALRDCCDRHEALQLAGIPFVSSTRSTVIDANGKVNVD